LTTKPWRVGYLYGILPSPSHNQPRTPPGLRGRLGRGRRARSLHPRHRVETCRPTNRSGVPAAAASADRARYPAEATTETRRRARLMCEGLGKTPVEVPDTRRGFVVNRLLFPLPLQPVRLHARERPDAEAVDTCMTLGAATMGPLALLDYVGLDVRRRRSATRSAWRVPTAGAGPRSGCSLGKKPPKASTSTTDAAAMLLRVHRIPWSTHVERVALALAHKRVDVEWVDHSTGTGRRSRAAERTGLRPGGRVSRDGASLTDSPLIIARWRSSSRSRACGRPIRAARRGRHLRQWVQPVYGRSRRIAIDASRQSRRPDAVAIAGCNPSCTAGFPGSRALLSARDHLLSDDFGSPM